MDKRALKSLDESGLVRVTPINVAIDLTDTSQYVKVPVPTEYRSTISGFAQQFPFLASVGSSSGLYAVKFPAGLPNTLMSLKQGGFGSSIIDPNTGKIAGTASFYPTANLAPFAAVFTALSIATCQYYLTEINKKFQYINMKMDKILAFLYEDKRAEILSEISFVKYATQNYDSIMLHDEQRIATIASLQQSRKVAMQNIEFYIKAMEMAAKKKLNDLKTDYRELMLLKYGLDLSTQLYMLSSILEAYYSQNASQSYTTSIESSITEYMEQSKLRVVSFLSSFRQSISGMKLLAAVQQKDRKEYEEKLSSMIESLSGEHFADIRSQVSDSLRALSANPTYIMTEEGTVYQLITG